MTWPSWSKLTSDGQASAGGSCWAASAGTVGVTVAASAGLDFVLGRPQPVAGANGVLQGASCMTQRRIPLLVGCGVPGPDVRRQCVEIIGYLGQKVVVHGIR